MFTTRTATKVSKTLIPTALKDSLKAAGNTKNAVRVVLFHDDSRKVLACDTRWSGGTRNEYYVWFPASESLIPSPASEGEELSVSPGTALVVIPHFCGQQLPPAVYVRNTDLAAFFGVAVPDTLPAEVAADWIDEQSENATKREAKRLRDVSEKLRKLTGLVSA